MNRDPRWLVFLDRAYALALYLYPRAFREEWGAQMRQAMRDHARACANDGRSAFEAVFPLLPDLVASAGQQQLQAFGEEAAMRRLLLGSALALSMGLFAMQARISTQLAQWQEARRWIALDTAYRNELRQAALASPEPAIRALVWTLDDPDAQGRTTHGASAQARISVVVGHDRLADFLAAASCEDPATLARLEAADPGNGAVWAVAATCAQRAKRTAAVRQALVALAQADHYDSRSGDLLSAGTDLLKRVPEPFVFMSSNSPSGLEYLGNILWYAHAPEVEAFGGSCSRQAVAADAVLAADCRAAAEVLSRADSDGVRRFGTAWMARYEGHPLDEAAFRERNEAQQQALAKWWALDDATRTTRIAGGGNEIDLLRN
ncbi:MAG: hypothetical protein QM719_07660 [Thermomonas sp.]